jgi:hypothetical protein
MRSSLDYHTQNANQKYGDLLIHVPFYTSNGAGMSRGSASERQDAYI